MFYHCYAFPETTYSCF